MAAAVPESPYALGRDPLETLRLEHQADELEAQTITLLDRAGFVSSGAAVDLGCGPAGALRLLSERVGSSGRVIGVDIDPVHVSQARVYVLGRGLTNVEVIEASASGTGLAAGAFDVVHARALLVNLPDPAAVVSEMARLAKPGGHVLVQEPDAGGRLCYPRCPAWDRLAELYVIAFQRDGADMCIGRRLPTLLRGADLDVLGVEVRADLTPPRHTRRTIFPDLARSLHPTIVALGLTDQAELDELDRSVRAHLDNPDVLVLPHLFFLAWAKTSPTSSRPQ
jgi:ubiquinone/menaquinone biosynthesis C-methylase UbiE